MFTRFPSHLARAVFKYLIALTLMVSMSSSAAEYRAFWVDAWNPGFLSQSQVDSLLGIPGNPNSKGTLRDGNCNTVIVQARRRFDVCYPSSVGEPYMSGLSPNNFNALAAIIKAAHDTTGGKKRIEVHCWSVAFKTSKGLVYSQHSDANNPENYWPTRIGSSTGAENGDGAFDPGHPKALEYLVNAHMDLVNFQTTAGPDGTDGHIDGIHYDYIRFEASTEGFNPTSVARYNARYGLTGEPSPSSEQFKQWRRDQVTAFVRQMYARIQKTKPWIKHSGSFITWNPSPTSSTRSAFMNTRPYYDVYSDWDSWMQEGLIDVAVPMTYYNWATLPNDYTRWMNFQKDRKGKRHMVVGPGTYLNSLSNAILEIKMTRDASPAGNFAHGFSGYNYRVPYIGGNWAGFAPSLVSQVTPTWDDIPAMPWKVAPTNAHLMGSVTLAGTSVWADHATVSITGPVNRSMTVDGTGFYAFIDLPVGNYTVTASKAGYQNLQTNANIAIGSVTGNMYERNFVLNLVGGKPVISFQPQDKTVYQGASVDFAVTASGGLPLSYQWRFGGTNLSGETSSLLTIAPVSTTNGGNYDIVITNSFGSVTSEVATLTVIVPPPHVRLIPLWNLPVGSRSYLANASTERGLAHNPARGRLLLVSRAGSPNVIVLNSTNGAELHNLSLSSGIISGGTYTMQMVGAADDGAVYVGNLSGVNGASDSFKLYRWANDNPGTLPTVAFSGIPIPGNLQRWGDTFDVRGSGANTQIIIGSRTGTNAVIFTTANGINFTPNAVNISGITGGGLGIAFGEGNTFWTKERGGTPLRQIGFSLGSNVGTVLRSHAIAGTTGPIGISPILNIFAGVAIDTPDHLRVYDLTTNGGNPILIETNSFPTDNDNSNGTGAVDFSGDRIFALDSNNGIIAMQLLPPPTPPSILTGPEEQLVVEGGDAEFSVSATGSAPLAYQWYFNGGEIFGAITNSYTRTNSQISDVGDYTVVITNNAGVVTSAVARLAFVIPPSISQPLQDRSVNQGSTVTFTVSASGTASLVYQWKFNGTNISGAMANSHTITDAQESDEGEYSIIVTNEAGSAERSATLTVIPTNVAPVIMSQPTSQSVKQGSNVVFAVEASGVPSPTYQWRFKGTNILGATLPNYGWDNVQTNQAGEYSVIVSNAADFVISSNAMLTVVPLQPLHFDGFHLLPNLQMQMQISGEPGTYLIEGSLDFTNWFELRTVTNTNGVFEFTDPETNLLRRFYRTKTPE